MKISFPIIKVRVSPGKKTYLAKIIGDHPKWRFKRLFILPDATTRKPHVWDTGENWYILKGIGWYEVQEGEFGRIYIRVLDDRIIRATYEDVCSIFLRPDFTMEGWKKKKGRATSRKNIEMPED